MVQIALAFEATDRSATFCGVKPYVSIWVLLFPYRPSSTLRTAALSLGYISAQEFDRVTDPASMVGEGGIGEL